MKNVTPFITFDGRAEEAINFYCSLVDNSKINSIQTWGPGGPVSEGNVLTASFELNGQRFLAMDVDGGVPLGEGRVQPLDRRGLVLDSVNHHFREIGQLIYMTSRTPDPSPPDPPRP